MPEQDIVDTIKGLPPERQKALIGKMTPEQKGKLSNAIRQRQSNPGATMSAMPPITSAAGIKSRAYTYGEKALNLLPTVGGAVGGILGAGAGAGPGSVPGAIGGAALGGAAGEAASQIGKRLAFGEGPTSSTEAAKQIGKEGAIQGAMEATGQVAGRALKAAGPALTKSADESMSRIIGFSSKKKIAEKVGAGQSRNIGKVVSEHVGPTKSLDSLLSKITNTKETFNRSLEAVVKSPQSRLTNLHAIIDDAALKTSREMELAGNESGARAILKRADELRRQYPQFASPEQVLKFKRAISGAEAALPSSYISRAAVASNAAIKNALPQKEAAEFLAANGKISALIDAEKALKVKMAREVAKGKALHVGIGGTIGAGLGYEAGGGKGAAEGALAGSLAGYGVARAAETTLARTTGAATKKALGQAATKLAPYAAKSAHAARAVQAINTLTSAPQTSR